MSNNAKKTKTDELGLENASFKSELNGFKRSQVNMYITSLKKKFAELQSKYNQLVDESANLRTLAYGDDNVVQKLERQLSEVNLELEREKNASSSIEKECIRLQGEIDNLKFKLAKRGDSDVADETGRRNIFGAALSKKLNNVIDMINGIKTEFSSEDSLVVEGGDDFSELLAGGSLGVFDTAPAYNEPATQAQPEQAQHKKNTQEQQETPAASDNIEIKPTLIENDGESDINNSFINAAKVAVVDDFENILSDFSKEYKSKGEDLQAKNPLEVEKGADLVATNPLTVEKGDNLSSEMYEIHIGDTQDGEISVDAVDTGANLDNLGFMPSVQEDDMLVTSFSSDEEDDDIEFSIFATENE